MSHSAQKKKKGSNFSINTQIIPKVRTSNFITFSKVNNNKDISHDLPIMTTPLDFIRQKKKFIIQDSFDKRGSKNFLKSKEEAMMEIILDDEIFDENKNKYNTNNSFIETNADTTYTKNIERRRRMNTISPVLRKRKTKNGKSKYSNFVKNIDENANTEKKNNDNYNIFINNKNNDNSKGSDYLYKFILDNANETEDNFQKKFDKIVKEAENQQKNKNLKKAKYHSTLYENQGNSHRYNSTKNKKKKISIFEFSEQAKLLMKKEGLEESSISSTSNNKKLLKKNSFNSKIVSRKNVFLEQNEIGIVNNKNKDSLFSILDIMG